MTKCLWAALFLVLGCSVGRAEPSPLRDGDIIFQTSRSAQSLAIQRATRSPYSHMGMVLHRGAQPFVLEAAATVRYTPLAAWIARGQGGHYVVKRLRGASARLDEDAVQKLKEAAAPLEGKRYDLRFEWSDARVYCSELVYKIYERALSVRIGELATLGSFDQGDPLVRDKLDERFGGDVPLDEPVIAPAAMFASPELELIEER
jgi:hypothetical protein